MNRQQKYNKTRNLMIKRQWMTYGFNFCECCKKPGGVEGSHRVPRSVCIGEYEWLYYDESNIDLFGNHWTCDCHDKMPNGKKSDQFTTLRMRNEIMEFYRKHHREYFNRLQIRYEMD